MYFTDPSLCTYHQNQGVINCKLVNGVCHACEIRKIAEAAARANDRRRKQSKSHESDLVGGRF